MPFAYRGQFWSFEQRDSRRLSTLLEGGFTPILGYVWIRSPWGCSYEDGGNCWGFSGELDVRYGFCSSLQAGKVEGSVYSFHRVLDAVEISTFAQSFFSYIMNYFVVLFLNTLLSENLSCDVLGRSWAKGKLYISNEALVEVSPFRIGRFTLVVFEGLFELDWLVHLACLLLFQYFDLCY